MPPSKSHNSRLVYRVIATIWPETQTDIIRRFKIVKTDLKRQSQQPHFNADIANEASVALKQEYRHQENSFKNQTSTTYFSD